MTHAVLPIMSCSTDDGQSYNDITEKLEHGVIIKKQNGLQKNSQSPAVVSDS